MKRIVKGIIVIIVLLLSATYSCEIVEVTHQLIVSMDSINDLRPESFTAYGTLVDIEGRDADQHGFCWSGSEAPTIENDFVNRGTKRAASKFSSEITGLTPNSTYYLRAYAQNENGISYSKDRMVTTPSSIEPVVITKPVKMLSSSTALAEGEISYDGGAPLTAQGICWSSSPDPTLQDPHTSGISGPESYFDTISGLGMNTIYYFRAYATNQSGTGYGDNLRITTYNPETTVADYDGNIYNIVQIGKQTWMAENLKTTHFWDGRKIEKVVNRNSWYYLTENRKAYCWYDDEWGNGEVLGALYNYAAASDAGSQIIQQIDIQGVCPTGWHLPGDDEWKELERFLGVPEEQLDNEGIRGEEEQAGCILKSDELWYTVCEGANLTGFSALPAGRRYFNGRYMNLRSSTYFWTTEESRSSRTGLNVICRTLSYESGIGRYKHRANNGHSVRCIKDD